MQIEYKNFITFLKMLYPNMIDNHNTEEMLSDFDFYILTHYKNVNDDVVDISPIKVYKNLSMKHCHKGYDNEFIKIFEEFCRTEKYKLC